MIAAGCLLHDTGMSIHRTDHEAYSLFLAADKLGLLAALLRRAGAVGVAAEAMHAIIGHRRRGEPFTIEAGHRARRRRARHGAGPLAGPLRVGAAEHPLAVGGRDRGGQIEPGEEKAVRIEIDMNNSAGVFQVDELLATKLRGSGLEDQIEVVARIDAEHEKRLVPVFRI